MVAAVKFNSAIEKIAEGNIDLDGGTLAMALTNSAPTASTGSTLADITQIANGNGYTANGAGVTPASSSHSSGTYTLVFNDITALWTATGGAMAGFRYIVLHDGSDLIMYWDLGSTINLNSGDSLNIDFTGATITFGP
jgi:hypothetical protein